MTEIMITIGITVRKNLRFLFKISDAVMDVDSFACFDVIFLKKACNAIAIPEKRSPWFKNRTQELEFLEIRYYANSVHF